MSSTVRKPVREFIRAAEKLLDTKDLSEEESGAVREMLGRLTTRFPDEGDDAAD
ncbi:MAG TPA: hypothetical protein VFS39_07605 [Nitrospira sp.]|nr:hypothetical protein [Nitrospira sp.]